MAMVSPRGGKRQRLLPEAAPNCELARIAGGGVTCGMRNLVAIPLVLLAVPAASFAGGWSGWEYGAYVDGGYLKSDNDPDNRTWRSKSTTFELDRIEANMATAYVRKQASEASRWGFEFGLQTGVDTDGLVTSAPPPAYESIRNADTWTIFAPTTLSYLFGVGNGLSVTGGLLSGHIAYESYHARNNPNYTRGYLTDYVPYFAWGVQASYPFNAQFTADLIVNTGYNYLTNPNDAPSWGAQLTWRPAGALRIVQNLYYGPDQSDTALEYWRFLSDTFVEWRSGMYLVAAAFDFGNERQAWLPDTPYYRWMSGAVWGQLHFSRSWRFAVRPEFYWDPDGLMTGAEQTISAVTTTLEYVTTFLDYNDLSVRVEYRFDRSTGDGGGFYSGSDNHLVPEQNLLVVAVMWSFEWKGEAH
jgi:hypothetical protein